MNGLLHLSTAHKVLHVTPFYPPDAGGIAIHVSNICSILARKGNDIHIAASRRWGRKISLEVEETCIFRIPSFHLPGWPYPTLRSIGIPADFGRSLSRLIKTGTFEIIHVHGHHYPLTWLAINSAHKRKIPVVLTLHGMYALRPDVLGGKSRLEDIFNKVVFRRILDRSTAVIGLTNQITSYARNLSNRPKFVTIPNGVHSDIFSNNLRRKTEYRKAYDIDDRAITILFIGRFEHVKGIIELATAVKALVQNTENKIEVIIVGAGSLENKVRSILHGIDRIHLLPWQPYEKLHELYIASDVFLIPSKFEGLPITVLEAMNAGLHIIYTPVGGLSEVLDGYAAKTLLRECSVDEILGALGRLLDDNNLASVSVSELIHHAQKFEWKAVVDNIDKLYEEILGSSCEDKL
jgi:glycosyltransferase involved in cell wall biosynthesis